MSGSPFDWPALRPETEAGLLTYERAVWGKVHGARSDYRWIARSAGFDRHGPALERQLVVGVEDRPHRATFWRALPEVYLAAGIYPSRSTDAAGRGGHLIEKQVLAWTGRDAEGKEKFPAALGALVLLSHVATLGDEVWWSRRGDPGWARDDFVLPLDGSEHPPLAAGEETLRQAIESGLEALASAVSESALVAFYGELLAGRRPAWLRGLERPLPPAALAALLLPLPRRLADRLSFAGWVPSSRVDLEQLADRWQVVVEPADRKLAPADRPGASEDGWALARALLDGDPSLASPVVEKLDIEADLAPRPAAVESAPPPAESAEEPSQPAPPSPTPGWDPFDGHLPRPGVELPLSDPPEGAPAVIRALHAFARDAGRRWLTPRDLAVHGSCRPLPADDPAACRLIEWVRQVEDHRPFYAHSEQWAVKVDLLRAAAIALVPDPSTLEAVGRLTSGRVPPLFFGGLIEPGMRQDDCDRSEPLLRARRSGTASLDSAGSASPGGSE